MDPDPVGSGLFLATRIWIRIQIFQTGCADPDPKKMDRICNTDLKYYLIILGTQQEGPHSPAALVHTSNSPLLPNMNHLN